jgi:hypothetical protein
MRFPRYLPLVGLLALSAQSHSQTFTSVSLGTPSLVSSTNGGLKPGALYKYSNAATGIDAYMQIVKTSNSGTDAVGLFAFDNSSSVNNPGGYTSAFQPVTSCSKSNSSGLWTTGGCSNGDVKTSHSANENYLVHFRLFFKKSGTQTDTAINVRASFIDIDGFGGSSTEAEQNAFMPGISYAVSSNTDLGFTQRPDGLINAEGPSSNVGGINLTNATSIAQVVYLNRTFIDFAVGMNTHSANTYGSCYDGTAGGRLHSVSFSTPQLAACTTIVSTKIALSGTVWNDADNSANNTFTNIRTNSEPGSNGGGLYVYALDSATGTVIDRALVGSNGTWTISDIPKGLPIKLLLSSENVTEGTTNGAPASVVNVGWTATTPLQRSSFRPSSNTINLDFGVQRPPVGANYTAATQQNPGGTIQVSVPTAAFTGTDAEDGSYASGLTGKKVTLTPGSNGDLYYNGTKLTGATTITSFDPTKVKVDPTGPMPTSFVAVTTTLTYSVFDAGGAASTPTTITLPFDAALCVNIRVYLEGALINNGNAVASDGRPLMRDNLRNSPYTTASYIPKRDPYEFATPYVNVVSKFTKLAPQNSSNPQFQQVTDSTTVFSVTGQNAIVDWVFVELRNKSNKASVSATRAGLIQRDGDIVDVDGVSCLSFPGVAIDSYYVAVRHRSHLGTMTKYAQSAANLQSLVNLTVTSTPLFDKGTVGFNNFSGLSQKAGVKGTYRAMWQGDFNADGKVKYDNPNDDLATMLFDVLLHPNNTNGATNFDFAYGYRQGDYNMNSKVKFDNPDDDNAMLLFQELLYPININGATNFDFLIQQLP